MQHMAIIGYLPAFIRELHARSMAGRVSLSSSSRPRKLKISEFYPGSEQFNVSFILTDMLWLCDNVAPTERRYIEIMQDE